MIIVCPTCARRYRIDDGRLGDGARRVRCTGCGQIFAATPPAAGPGSSAPGGDATPSIPSAPTAGGAASGPLVLVADEAREFRDLVQRLLESSGCRVVTTDDGEEAFRLAVSRRPVLMVLNVYLRRLLGVAVCEGVKGSPDLKTTRVALVGSVFKSDRFVRSPGNLYGADDYFEDVIPPDELRDRLLRLVGQGSPPPAPAPRRVAAAPEAVQAGGGAHLPPPGRDTASGALDPRAEVRRLARIMLSDLKIYYPEEFRSAVAGRRVFETFREELIKGKELITHRFPDLPDRLEVLATALREGIDEERVVAARPPAGSPA